MQFFVPMKISTVTHQEKQVHVVNGKPVFYEPAELKQARANLTDYLAQYAPEKPVHGNIRLLVKWCFPLKPGTHDGEYKNTKPDLDNSMKMLQDVMTTLGFWDDDRFIVSLITEKFYAQIPGLFIQITKSGVDG